MSQLDHKSEAWSALFSEPVSDLVKRYTASVFFDKRLWLADITGSLAHAAMLERQGVISATDGAEIRRGMAQVRSEIESGAFEWKLDLEDVHLNIEARSRLQLQVIPSHPSTPGKAAPDSTASRVTHSAKPPGPNSAPLISPHL